MPTAFISYCQKQNEKDWLPEIVEFLTPLFNKHGYRVWLDKSIGPGEDWNNAITNAIQRASVALLLVSPGFLASEFIMKEELPLILKERSRGLMVFWIPISRGIWQATRLLEVQAAIDPKDFLDELSGPDQRKALDNIAKQLEHAFSAPSPLVPDSGSKKDSPSPPTSEKVQVNVDVHDRARIKRLAERNKTPKDTFLSAFLHQALFNEELHITYRHESEIRGGDDLLRSASDAQFIALTYKTLGLALTKGNLTLPKVARVEIAVYPLPILKSWHPTLRGESNEFALRDEWLLGVTNVLARLTSRAVTPKLQTLDLRILNRVPTFTSSLLTTKSKEGDLLRIRFTPSLEDVEPSATPTMNLVLYTDEGARPEPVFQAYARIIDNMRSRSRPLVFPVMRGGHEGYVRPNLKTFVNRLGGTTNDGRYGHPDARFEVKAAIDERLARKFRLMNGDKATESPIHPDAIYQIFDELRASGKSSCFKVTFDLLEHKAIIRAGAETAEKWITFDVVSHHTVGAFAVLTKETPNGRSAILKLKPKQWPYDVPGGKVARTDESIKDTVTRELFEELGLEIRQRALQGVDEFKYDPRGGIVHTPVIAVYYHYKLNNAEADYLERILPNATDGFPLKTIDVRSLIEKKRSNRQHGQRIPVNDKDLGGEALCHAPLEVFLRIQREQQGRREQR